MSGGVTLEVLDPRSDPEPSYWEQLRVRAGLWPNWRYDVVRAITWTSQAPLLLTVLRDGSTPVGVVSAFLSGLPLRAGSYLPATGLRQVGLLDVRAPHSAAQQGWWFDPGLSPTARAELARAYTAGMRRELGWRVWAVAWRHVRTADLPWLTTRRALLRPAPAVAVLDLPFSSVEQWRATLARRRRMDLERQVRRLAENPNLVTRTGHPADLVTAEELAMFWAANTARHAGGRRRARPIRSAAPWLRPLATAPDTWAIVYRDAFGRPLAAHLALDHATAPIAALWGAVPRERGGVAHLYFDLYQRMIRWAVEAQRPQLWLGPGMLELKARLGARAVPEQVLSTRL